MAERTTSGKLRGTVIVALSGLGAGGMLAANLGGRTHTVERTQTFPAAPAALIVDNNAGTVIIDAVDRTSAEVAITGTWYGHRPQPSVRLDASGNLRLQGCQGSQWASFGLWHQKCAITFRVSVPAGTRVDAHSDHGAIQMRGRFGDVQVTTDTGAIRLGELTATRVRASSDLGRIDAQVSAPEVNLRSDTGTVTAGLNTQRAVLRSDLGSITATFTRPPERADLRTDIGDLTVELPLQRYRIDASADIGSTRIDDRLVGGSGPGTIVARVDIGTLTIRAGAAVTP